MRSLEDRRTYICLSFALPQPTGPENAVPSTPRRAGSSFLLKRVDVNSEFDPEGIELLLYTHREVGIS